MSETEQQEGTAEVLVFTAENWAKMVESLAKPGAVIASEITGAKIILLRLGQNIFQTVADLSVNYAVPGINSNAQEANRIHALVGMNSEAGELLDVIKAHAIYNKPLDVVHITEEIGDLLWYRELFGKQEPSESDTRLLRVLDSIVGHLLAELQLQKNDVLKANWDKLKTRYENFLYSDEQAIARADKAE